MTRSKFLLALATCASFLVASCGGGPGSGTSGTSVTLVSSVGSLSSKSLALGDPSALDGSTRLARLLRRLDLREAATVLASVFVGTASAQQVSVPSCAYSTLVGSTDLVNWEVIHLTADRLRPPCINQMEDAGDFLVVKTSTVRNAAGATCDLVAIRKATGDTHCIVVDLPDRSLSGPPVFNLGLDRRDWLRQGQLTPNGRYFFTAFVTDRNPGLAYAGFLRLDLGGASPVASLAYLESGAANADDGSINGHLLAWGPFWGRNNGDLVFTEFTPASNDLSSGVARHYLAIHDPARADAAQVERFLLNVSDAADRVDAASSPLGAWFKDGHPQATSLFFDAEILPNPSGTDADHSIYLTLEADGLDPDACAAGSRRLVKATPDRSTREFVFDDLGSTRLGNGWGSRPGSSNVTLAPDGASLVTVRMRASLTAGHVEFERITRAVTASACDATATLGTPYAVDASLVARVDQFNDFVNETPGYLFFRSFNDDPADASPGSGCVSGLGCAVNPTSVAFSYDKATGAITQVPLGVLGTSNFYLQAIRSAVTSDKLYLGLKDATGTFGIHAVILPGAVQSVVRLPQGVDLRSLVVSGS